MASGAHTVSLSGRYYRMKLLAEAGDVLTPAHAPEGRFHRDGQRALYLSASPEGCIVATARYVTGDPAPRGIFPLDLQQAQIVDLHDGRATAALGIDTTHRACEWQDMRTQGLPAPTWDIADRVRALGLDGMLYASRSDPRKTHLTLFRWNEAGSNARLSRAGDPIPFQPVA